MFIANPDYVKGRSVYATRTISAWNGMFTKGHEFTIKAVTANGLDLIDQEGNELRGVDPSDGSLAPND